MLGIGGGPLYVTVYTAFVARSFAGTLPEDEQVKLILACSIFSVMMSGITASFRNWRNGHFYFRPVLFLGMPAIITAISITAALPAMHFTRSKFSMVFILMMLPMLARMILTPRDQKKFNQPQSIKTAFLLGTGVLSGFFTALSGLGGGFAIIPLLNGLFNIKIRKVLSISLGVIMVVATSLTIYNLFFTRLSHTPDYTIGTVNFSFTLPVLAGVFISSNLGVITSQKLSPTQLRYGVIIFCVCIIGKTIWDIL